MAFGLNPAVVDSSHYGHLNCPCGGGGNLHHGNVTVFKRGEDGDITTVIAQNGDTAQTSKFPSADTCNPSPRRSGMLIEFECEQCPEKNMRLAIFQHKGDTFVEWV